MVNELRAVVHELGGERALGRTLSNDRDVRAAIRAGIMRAPHSMAKVPIVLAGAGLAPVFASPTHPSISPWPCSNTSSTLIRTTHRPILFWRSQKFLIW